MKCVICGEEIAVVGTWAQGNNAEPVCTGRCCDRCNTECVIPVRLNVAQFIRNLKVSKVKKDEN